jgi:hypothetical protein
MLTLSVQPYGPTFLSLSWGCILSLTEVVRLTHRPTVPYILDYVSQSQLRIDHVYYYFYCILANSLRHALQCTRQYSLQNFLTCFMLTSCVQFYVSKSQLRIDHVYY